MTTLARRLFDFCSFLGGRKWAVGQSAEGQSRRKALGQNLQSLSTYSYLRPCAAPSLPFACLAFLPPTPAPLREERARGVRALGRQMETDL